ncbi:polysaccharide biosynthesis/export family protein [Catenovulum agarivorans]|uniref:polysaccharide biosynthesis/export family protein n=1 Tax=Catenovulum agarivorans TaxID=1172192 RepID=UPI00030E8B05|nr:polysaccharide biosynthesis/export family protein [Catenovulum agarivorans]
MKVTQHIISFVLIACSGLLSFAQADQVSDYVLSVDDQISVLVFNEPELSIKDTRISASGSIKLPLIGQINANGLTVKQLENQIHTELLKGYLKKPDVTITITEYRPFYINGEVKKPGSYPFRKDLTVEKAITLAGGFTERASKSAVSLVGENNSRQIKSVQLSEAVKPGDVITVSESFF